MLPLRRRSSFTPPPTAFERKLVPILSTMLASLAPILPVVVETPLLPPFGFMVFIGWRLLRSELWPLWMGLPLGLFDDLASGQPLGTAMFGWTVAMLALDLLDRRTGQRSHVQDWGVAVLLIAGNLLLALGLVRLSGGNTPVVLLIPQIVISALAMPLVGRLVAALDRWRLAR